MYLGTFLACLGALFLELLATRVLGVVQGPETIVYTVAVAMLGMGAAGSLLTILPWKPEGRRAHRAAAVFCILASLSVLLLFAFAHEFKEILNRKADQSVGDGDLEALIVSISESRVRESLLLGAVMSLPYFFYGAVVALVIKVTPRDRQHRVYAADLLGAALGCLLAVVALEETGFVLPLVAAILIPLLAAAAYLRQHSRRGAAVTCVLAMGLGAILPLPSIATKLEPRPHVIRLAKLWRGGGYAEELWHTWNSYSRIAAVRLRYGEAGKSRTVMALGIGEGHAILQRYHGPEHRGGAPYLPARLATAACRPKRVLVLFAGAGRDMIALDEVLQGQAEIVGVELNRQLVEWPMSQGCWRLEEFFDRPNIDLIVAEGREFLHRDSTRYDSILLSWSGANITHYTGAAGHTARFLYTREALVSLLDHLQPGGQLTILNTNKIKILAALREIDLESGQPSLKEKVVLLDAPDDRQADWRQYWDENRLVIKPSGFTPGDLGRLRQVAADEKLRVRYAPDVEFRPDDPYHQVICDDDLAATLAALGPPNDLDFSVSTDDRPFILDLFPTSAYLTSSFWSGSFFEEQTTPARRSWRLRRDHFKCLLFFALAGLVLIYGPLILTRGTAPWTWQNVNHLVYFGSLGAGFMFVEIGFIQKLSLFLGHPGHAIGLVLASLILFSGCGSLLSSWTFRRGILGFRRAASLGCVLSLGLLWFLDAAKADLLALPFAARATVVFLALAPLGLVVGHLFPQGLARLRTGSGHLAPWALAVNSATGTLAAGLGIAVAQTSGFSSVVLAGVFFYLVIAVMPHGPRSHPATS